MNLFCRYYILLLCLLSTTCTYAAADSLQYQHYTVDNGLPSNNVYSCIQDHNGYIWFTTDNGIVKYNGYTFKLFNVAKSGLPDNDIYKITEDGTGRIWLHTFARSFGYIENDRYYNIDFHKSINRLSMGEHMVSHGRDVMFDIRFNIDLNAVLFRDTSHFVCLPLGMILGINRQERIYFTDKIYIYQYNLLKPLLPPQRLFEYPKVLHDINNKGGYTIMYGDYNIVAYQQKANHFMSLDVNTGIAKKVIISGDTNESFYTSCQRWAAYDFISDKFAYHFNDSATRYVKEALPTITGNQVAFICPDNNRDKWYCTNGDGIWKKYSAGVIFRKTALCNEILNALQIPSLNTSFQYWWDSKNKILYEVDTAARIRKWSVKGYGNVSSVSPGMDTNVVLCTSFDMLRLSRSNGHTTPLYNVDKMILPERDTNVPVQALLKSRVLLYYLNADKIVSSNASSLLVTSQKNDTVHLLHNITGDRYGIMDPQCVCGKLIFASRQNIAVYDTVFDKLIILKTDSLYNQYFNKIIAIRHDRWNNIYFLTDTHLILLNPYTLKWRVLEKNIDLNQAKIDVSGDHLVIAGRFGIAAAKIGGLGKIGIFYTSLNVKDQFYKTVKGMFTLPNDTVLLQTNKGIYTTSLHALFTEGYNSDNISLDRFNIVAKEPYSQNIRTGDTIAITQENNRLTLDVINMYGNGAVQYNYMTDPGQAWQETSSGEIVTSEFSPGIYYHLKVTVSDEVMKSDIRDMYIYIIPYWYQTHNAHVFFLIAGSLILILAVIGIISLVRQATIRAQAKKRMLTELELRAVYSQINPHFIFNTLSTALYFIDKKDYDNAYKHVNKFSHLLRSYLKSSHDRYILLSEEIDMLKRYIELQQTRFENLFTYEIKVNNKVPADHIQMPSLLLQPLVENAINHGLFHRKEPGGLLYISFEQGRSPEELVCIIEDNGIGRMRAMDLKKANDAERTSYGSKLTDKLVDIFRQYEAMNIHIEYIDKTQPETGTIVRLTIGNVKYVV